VLELPKAALGATIQRLLEQLQQDSHNSLRPPSNDLPLAASQGHAGTPVAGLPPGARPQGIDTGVAAGRGSGRGNPGQAWALLSLSASLAGGGYASPAASGDRHPLSEPGRRRVSIASVGLPGLRRSDPGRDIRRVLWEAFGPHVRAIGALCTGEYHLSKRATQNVLEDLFGVTMSGGHP
jgi:hypothetical protein